MIEISKAEYDRLRRIEEERFVPNPFVLFAMEAGLVLSAVLLGIVLGYGVFK
jgi:hypothetical protein